MEKVVTADKKKKSYSQKERDDYASFMKATK